MNRYIWLLLLALHCLFSTAKTTHLQDFAQTRPRLSPQAQISLLTCSPSDDAVFTLYGHAALRVNDPINKIDRIYNYGMFEFSQPNFIYRFAKGETDYNLGVSDISYFLFEYMSRGSEIYEQVLNLLQEEKEGLWRALEWNAQPENRVYRYNFFYDNCSTRPVDMIENNLQGIIRYAPPTDPLPTFRNAINYCTRYHPWQTFGCDLVLGLPTDRMMTQRETFFLPDNVKNDFNKAEIVREGNATPLVKQINILAKEDQQQSITPFYCTPLFCFSAFFILIMTLTGIEFSRKKQYRIIDVLLFFTAGIGGCILFFLSFISVHPCTFPNISLLWLNPLHLTGIILFSVKKFNTVAFWYHLINFAVVIVMLMGWIFIPQHFNLAFIPLIASLLLRSGGALIREKNLKG